MEEKETDEGGMATVFGRATKVWGEIKSVVWVN